MKRAPKRKWTDELDGRHPRTQTLRRQPPSLLPQGSSVASSFFYHRGTSPELPRTPDPPETQHHSWGDSAHNTPQESPAIESQSAALISPDFHSQPPANDSLLDLEYESFLKPIEIRLVRIAIGESRNAPLSLQLKTFDKASAPHYTAITYAWGTSTIGRHISVNGKDTLITENLYDFLVEARSRQWDCSWNGVWLWIDALSINQRDPSEKNAHVPTMKDIYEQADEILAWLGGLRLHESCSQAIKSILDGHDPKEILKGRVLKAVMAFAESQWWSRAWVVQEASTPTEHGLQLWYGPSSTYLQDWSEVRRRIRKSALQQLADPEFHQESSGTSMRANYERMVHFHGGVFNQVKRKRMRDQSDRPCELLGLLENGRQSHSTDPKDKVYAFVAIASEEVLPKPRYEDSLLDVYTEVVRIHLRHKKNLDILSHSFPDQSSLWFASDPDRIEQRRDGDDEEGEDGNHDDDCSGDDASGDDDGDDNATNGNGGKLTATSTHDDEPRCPSWVPDWSAKPVVRTFPRIFGASGSQALDARILDDGTTLRVRGVVADTIEAVCHAVPGKATGFPLREWVDFATGFARDDAHRAALKRVFGRVLCADIHEYRRRGSSFAFENPDGSLLDNYKMFNHTQIMTHIGTGRRKLLKTSQGRLGLGLYPMEPGDEVVVLFGGRTPFIVRRLSGGEGGQRYRFVSELYLDGIMDGEALEGVDLESEARYFDLV